MKDYLICIDSDGCAMDTMTVKHVECFGPALIEIWALDQWKNEILTYWNDINLYTKTRGINRFKGLEMALKYIDVHYAKVEGLDQYVQWLEQTDSLSATALSEYIKLHTSECLTKALSWSVLVNRKIKLIEEDFRPFEGMSDILETLSQQADIVIVSSANQQAVYGEWQTHGLMPYVTEVMTQENGTKAKCIELTLKRGYRKDQALMIGDAPGDYEAARTNEISYYPILAGKENESWHQFIREGLGRFVNGSYNGNYQDKMLESFWSNLSGMS